MNENREDEEGLRTSREIPLAIPACGLGNSMVGGHTLRSLAEPGVEEIEVWAKLNPEAPLGDEQLLKAWHWLRLNGPSSCWTNAGAVIVRMLLLEIFRVKLRSQQRKSRLVKIANRKRKELQNGKGS